MPGRIQAAVAPLLVPVLAVFTALVVGALVIAAAGASPLDAYAGLFQGAFGSARALSETAVWATPYIFAGLAVSLAVRGGLFNIGAEGQIAVGAVTAAVFGLGLPRWLGMDLPAVVHLPLTLLAGAAGGAAWGGLPGWLKARTGAHEVINTIMLNYIALNMVSFLLNGALKDPEPGNVIARTPLIAASAELPSLFERYRIHWGFPLALALAFGVAFLLRRTTLGFEIRAVGTNPDAAAAGGIPVIRTTVVTMALSGALAGLAGAVEVCALNHRHELGFSAGYGFDAIAVALLGRTHPAGVVFAGLLLGAMRNGATRMQFLTQIPVDVISVIQALILLFVAADVIVRKLYRLRTPGDRVALTRGWGA